MPRQKTTEQSALFRAKNRRNRKPANERPRQPPAPPRPAAVTTEQPRQRTRSAQLPASEFLAIAPLPTRGGVFDDHPNLTAMARTIVEQAPVYHTTQPGLWQKWKFRWVPELKQTLGETHALGRYIAINPRLFTANRDNDVYLRETLAHELIHALSVDDGTEDDAALYQFFHGPNFKRYADTVRQQLGIDPYRLQRLRVYDQSKETARILGVKLFVYSCRRCKTGMRWPVVHDKRPPSAHYRGSHECSGSQVRRRNGVEPEPAFFLCTIVHYDEGGRIENFKDDF